VPLIYSYLAWLYFPEGKERSVDIQAFNRVAWDNEVDNENPYSLPVNAEAVEAARQGDWEIFLSDTKPVPREWFPGLNGLDILCLASGGGQQGPILAAAGGNVTVFDISPKQLAQDRIVAERDSLDILTVEGDMADLSVFVDHNFDLIVHPPSNLFVPDVHPVWAEAFRVLRPKGIMLAGFMNPVEYMFDFDLLDNKGVLEVKNTLPFSSLTSLTEEERIKSFGANGSIEFSHTFEDQIGGQLRAGFVITGFYEDYRQDDPVAEFMPSYFVTKAAKL
jgi:SAM-dependent methyltransferase